MSEEDGRLHLLRADAAWAADAAPQPLPAATTARGGQVLWPSASAAAAGTASHAHTNARGTLVQVTYAHDTAHKRARARHTAASPPYHAVSCA